MNPDHGTSPRLPSRFRPLESSEIVKPHREGRRSLGASVFLRALVVNVVLSSMAFSEEPVRFARDVQPILSDKCFACHGPDAATRKGDLRLDRREDALAALMPGRAKESELVKRIRATDHARMPPTKAGKTLSAREIELLTRWIEQGAVYEKHWAFVPPRRPPLPARTEFVGSPIDHFVRERLRREALAPSPEAPRTTLIRRLGFDLIGLPPTPEEVRAFVEDTSPGAYEKVVDRLLASPHFGERLAMVWLDAARYSDTDGYQSDETRSNWPWRDWVVSAFNRNLPFDRFTIEQFAGDLLPGATADQKLATCFHRNHMTNGEGGRDPEESRIDYVIDRINTVGTVWLGLTLGCCQCHNHRYDPVSQAEYYSLFAFFNSIAEDGKAGRGAKPFLKVKSPSASQAVAAARQLVQRREAELEEAKAGEARGFDAWLAERTRAVTRTSNYRAWQPLNALKLEGADGSILKQEADGAIQSVGPDPHQEDYHVFARPTLPRLTGLRLEALPHASFTHAGLSRSDDGHFILTSLRVNVRQRGSSLARPVLLAAATADFAADKAKEGKGFGPIRDVLDDDPRTGWTARGKDPKEPRVAVFAFAEPIVLGPDEELHVELGQRSLAGHNNLGRFRLSVTDHAGPAVNTIEPPPLEALARGGSVVPESLRGKLLEQYLADRPAFLTARAALERARRTLGETTRAAGDVEVMVLEEAKTPRPSHVLVRGVWNKKGPAVERGVPEVLPPWSSEWSRDRLGLARWLVAPEHPLTARVIVNQFWQMLFGSGLVRTPDDFGLQGERPTHPEVLDWLAVEFVESGWNVKHLLRRIVTSDTYRQASDVTPALLARDPENRLLARAPRFRLPAWMLRDAALRVSGLFSPAVGGPPVRPHQPDGVWAEITMGRFQYEPSEGAEQYRRTLYAFWRRSIAPTFLFDSAQRRVCEVKVLRTNTPLQALTLWNDVTYLESARALAATVMQSAPGESARLTALHERVLARSPRPSEMIVLSRQYRRALGHYRSHPDDTRKILAHGPWRPAENLDRAEHAALSVVGSLLLNLDEAITRE